MADAEETPLAPPGDTEEAFAPPIQEAEEVPLAAPDVASLGGPPPPSDDASPGARRSSAESFPLSNSAVLQELKAADEMAFKTAKDIQKLREAIAVYVKKDTLTGDDTVALQVKQAELMAKLSEFEGITRNVQRLLGLADISMSQLPPSHGFTPIPSKIARSSAAISAPVERMPRVIVCGGEPRDNDLPKVILCEPTDYCKDFAQFPGEVGGDTTGAQYTTAVGQKPQVPRPGGLQWAGPGQLGGAMMGGGEPPLGYGGGGRGWPMTPMGMQQQPWGPSPWQQQQQCLPQRNEDGEKLKQLNNQVKQLVEDWERVLSSHRQLKWAVEVGGFQPTPQVYPDRPLCKMTLGEQKVCKVDIYKQMGIPLPPPTGEGSRELCPEAKKKLAAATDEEIGKVSPKNSSKKGLQVVGGVEVKVLSPTPRPPGGPICIFDMERILDDLRRDFENIQEICPAKAKNLPENLKEERQLKMDKLMQNLIKFQETASYVRKFGCCR